jgi:hypothetical protein
MSTLLIVTQISYRRDNDRRDGLYGEHTSDSKVNTHELADKVCLINTVVGFKADGCFQAPDFRYVV